MRTTFDIAVLKAINGFAGQSQFVDLVVLKFAGLNSVKVLPLVLCFIWVWFQQADAGEQAKRRVRLISALVGMFAALVVTRIMQNLMPYMPRPTYTPGLEINRPLIDENLVVADWSSFPSDHAALSFALAFGLWRVSRPAGAIAGLWAFVVVCLPRIYGGYHYPTDILAGALVGIACVIVAGWLVPRALPRIRNPLPAGFSEPVGYTAVFAILFSISTMFDDVRIAVTGAYDALIAGDPVETAAAVCPHDKAEALRQGVLLAPECEADQDASVRRAVYAKACTTPGCAG